MRMNVPAMVAGLVLMAGGAVADEMAPFVVQWEKDVKSPVDVSFLLDAPAGRHGFVRVDGGRLVFQNGQRFRMWGINVSGRGAIPAKDEAPIIAANLARLGINCVRFHFMDRPAPSGILVGKGDNTRSLDPEAMDRLDFFVFQLKQRGIYSDLNLNVARPYKTGDGVRDHELLGFAKATTWFDERLIELLKEYAKQLLTHRNPYTNTEYRAEPAVALVELFNENSLVEAWLTGRLLGKNTQKNPGTWADIPASYAVALTEKYNAWLAKRLPADELVKLRKEAKVGDAEPLPRLRPDEFAKASKERFHAEAEFYMSIEEQLVKEMGRYLREDVGVKVPLIVNSDHGHWKTGYPQLASISLWDVVDSHVYWQHPSYTRNEAGKTTGFWIPNTAMVDDPLHSSAVELSRSAFAGKPFTVSEVNHPFPAEHAAEGVPVLAAYAALQDWDGIFWYTLAHDAITGTQPRMKGHFDFCADPVKMMQLPAGAMMFLRGDVQAAKQIIERSYTRQQVYESIRLPTAQRPYYTPGFDLSIPLRHASRIRSFNGPATAAPDGKPTSPIRSDTGELTWHFGAKRSGLVVVDTPRSQAIVGYSRATKGTTRNFSAAMENEFCAVTLTSLDEKPVAQSSRLLLTAGSRVANTGMKWNDKRTTLEDWGKPPTQIDVVKGTITLTGLEGATRVDLQPLDGAGRPIGTAVIGARTGDAWTVAIGVTPTTWYMVTVTR